MWTHGSSLFCFTVYTYSTSAPFVVVSSNVPDITNIGYVTAEATTPRTTRRQDSAAGAEAEPAAAAPAVPRGTTRGIAGRRWQGGREGSVR